MHEKHAFLRHDGRPAPNEVNRHIASDLGNILARDQLDGLLGYQPADKARCSGQIRLGCPQAAGKAASVTIP